MMAPKRMVSISNGGPNEKCTNHHCIVGEPPMDERNEKIKNWTSENERNQFEQKQSASTTCRRLSASSSQNKTKKCLHRMGFWCADFAGLIYVESSILCIASYRSAAHRNLLRTIHVALASLHFPLSEANQIHLSISYFYYIISFHRH